MLSHLVVDASSVSAIWVTGKATPARVGRADNSEKYDGCFAPLDHDRQHVADRRAAQPPSANARRPPSIIRPPPRLFDEVGEHAELFGRERGGFDAAENDRAIREQLVAGLREPGDQFVGVGDVEPAVLVLGRALQDDDLRCSCRLPRRGG